MAKCVLLILVTVLVAYCEAKPQNRIIGGTPAINMQFPWHASLRITVSSSVQQSFCGGSVISDLFILTAASCLRNVISIQVDLGSVLFSSPLVTLHATAFLLHPNYNENFNTNDVAIIRLPHPIAFSANIRAISLPGLSLSASRFENEEVHIPGFGVTVTGGNIISEQLFFAHKRVISNNECLQHFSDQFIDDSTMCANGIDNSLQTSCFGDRGGGLVTLIAGDWTLLGITSLFHPNGCTGLTPAGYERLTTHVHWISSSTGIVVPP